MKCKLKAVNKNLLKHLDRRVISYKKVQHIIEILNSIYAEIDDYLKTKKNNLMIKSLRNFTNLAEIHNKTV